MVSFMGMGLDMKSGNFYMPDMYKVSNHISETPYHLPCTESVILATSMLPSPTPPTPPNTGSSDPPPSGGDGGSSSTIVIIAGIVTGSSVLILLIIIGVILICIRQRGQNSLYKTRIPLKDLVSLMPECMAANSV